MSKFSTRLKELRLQAGLSQQELSKATGISQNAICLYETGKNEPSIKTLLLLADHLDVTTDYILGRSDDRGSGAKPSLEKALIAAIEGILSPGTEAYESLLSSIKSHLGE